MAAILVALLVLSLTTNLFPMFNVVAILGLFPLRLFWGTSPTPDRRLGPRSAIHFLLAAYTFWVMSYLLTTAPLSNLISFDFLRFDGALFIGYLPLLLLGDVGLRPSVAYRLIWTYVGVLAGVVILLPLIPLVLLGPSKMMTLNTLFDFGPLDQISTLFNGLYRGHMSAGNQYAMATLIVICFLLRPGKGKFFSRAALILIGLLAGLLLAQARTAYVAFAATLLVQFGRQKAFFKPMRKLGVFGLVFITCFSLWNPSVISRFAAIANFQEANVATRFENFKEAARDFALSPVIGIGLGRYNDTGKTFTGIPNLVYIATGGQVVNQDIQTHNSYLRFLAEGGVVGLFLMLGIWAETYRWAGRLRRQFEETSSAAALCEAVQSAVLMTFFSSFTGTPMLLASTPLLVFTMVGLLRNVASYESRLQPASYAMSVGSLGNSGLTGLAGPAGAG